MRKKTIAKMLMGIFLLLSMGSSTQNSSVYNSENENLRQPGEGFFL